MTAAFDEGRAAGVEGGDERDAFHATAASFAGAGGIKSNDKNGALKATGQLSGDDTDDAWVP